eukprot:COSAG04_NODE_1445_length_6714_cov_1.982162_4_plen_258_part_00
MIPLMMEHGYRPTGWLGLILGTSVWYRFDPEAVQTDESFTRQIEATVREIGERGKVRAVGVPEGLPPKSLAPAPAPAPAAARPMPATPQPTSAQLAPAERSFTPTLSSPPQMQSDSLSSAAVVELLLERDEKLRSEAKAEKAELEARMHTEKAELRKEMQARLTELAPQEAISAERLTALAARLEALHAAQLLTDEELYALEDCLADFVDVRAAYSVVTVEVVHANASASKVLKLVLLSEGLAKDAAFVRQVRRKLM